MALTDMVIMPGADYQDIVDATREKTGGTDALKSGEVGAAIRSIQAGGGDIDALIERGITEIESNATKIGTYAFYQCESLTKADFPVATSIGIGAFKECGGLNAAFFPAVTSIGQSAFSACKELTRADFPLASEVATEAFFNCESLNTANFPALSNIQIKTFYGCHGLTELSFPALKYIFDMAFQLCTNLSAADFPAVISISSDAFRLCSSLNALILRSETTVKLNNVNALASTPIESGTGYIYVPAALVDTYKAAENWSTYANQFRALEDYTVDGTTTGALDPEKVGA